MNRVNAFLRDTRAASAVEFALVLPLFLILLLGTIDVGRYIWTVNQLEKATQIGARWAVATDMICSGLYDWSFASDQSPPVNQGDPVPVDAFPGLEYTGGDAECICAAGGTCSFPTTANATSFGQMVVKMNSVYEGIGIEDVSVQYSNSGLGYSGDPNGPDVSPLVTVTVSGVRFKMLTAAYIFNFQLPTSSYSLTNEDGVGDRAYY